MIQFTDLQRESFHQGRPVRLRDPDLGADVVVCPLQVFEEMERQMREFLVDDKEQEAWVETSMQDLARRLDEDDNGLVKAKFILRS